MSQVLDGEQVSNKERDGDGQYVWMCKRVKCQNIRRRYRCPGTTAEISTYVYTYTFCIDVIATDGVLNNSHYRHSCISQELTTLPTSIQISTNEKGDLKDETNVYATTTKSDRPSLRSNR